MSSRAGSPPGRLAPPESEEPSPEARAPLTETASDAPIAAASQRHSWTEWLPASAATFPGDVLVLDPLVAGAVKPCDGAADRTLVGVAAGPSVDGRVEVAIAKIHQVRVDAAYGAITPGDLLTTSATPGAAMRATADGPGTILGKALEPLEAGTGTIRVLLMPR